MRGGEVRFHADPADLVSLFGRLDERLSLTFTEQLSELNEQPRTIAFAKDLVEFAMTDEASPQAMFLVTRKGSPVALRQIVMEDGSGLKMSARSTFNPEGVVLRLAGEDQGANTFVPSAFNTTADTDVARALFNELKKQIVRMSTYGQGFYIFPGALAKHHQGWRLAGGAQVSRSLDVVVPRHS